MGDGFHTLANIKIYQWSVTTYNLGQLLLFNYPPPKRKKASSLKIKIRLNYFITFYNFTQFLIMFL